MESNCTKLEAELFGRYLLGRPPSGECVALYEAANDKIGIVLDAKDSKILEFALANPWAIGCIDQGLALFKRDSNVRRKIFVMLAILETSPDYSGYFLPAERSPLYLLYIAWVGISASMKAVIGGLILKFI